ncbi:hypothetical protein C8A00DRAFT_38475 [Chaetomidium leptoderma]|uniref:Uncharacterized protein n=1 Tax=Chaetomidium leptoderma TaxID=669021 RepID=A0AAN6VDM1_9PEZI|nr:hypothetical protein C8A00DRAFT_38475 [Chaetomidium leptoderma]
MDARPIDHTPRQYVWVNKTGHPQDQPRPDDAEQPVSISREHQMAVNQGLVRISTLRPPNAPYLRWDLPSTLEQLLQLLRHGGIGFDMASLIGLNWHYLRNRRRPVFVEYHNGLYFGRVMAGLFDRQVPRRADALFVQAFGDQNKIPCRCCDVNHWSCTTAVVHENGHQSDSARVNVMWPFFGCVSFGHIDNGRCGNCLWLGKECSWSSVTEGHLDWELKGKATEPQARMYLDEWSGLLVRSDPDAAMAQQVQRYTQGYRGVGV